MRYKLKPGAPPDGELFIRVTVRHKYKPRLEYYNEWPEENLRKPTSYLEAMAYDETAIENHVTSVLELIEGGEADGLETFWELVDAEGNVWSESIEDQQEEEVQ